MLAIRTPSGILITHTARDNRAECCEDYILYLLHRGALQDRPECTGDKWYSTYWDALRQAGYSIVEVSVIQRSHGSWKWPELVPKTLFNWRQA